MYHAGEGREEPVQCRPATALRTRRARGIGLPGRGIPDRVEKAGPTGQGIPQACVEEAGATGRRASRRPAWRRQGCKGGASGRPASHGGERGVPRPACRRQGCREQESSAGGPPLLPPEPPGTVLSHSRSQTAAPKPKLGPRDPEQGRVRASPMSCSWSSSLVQAGAGTGR